MSSPSSAKISASSAKINASSRSTKRDVNASRASRAFGASSISNSSRKVNGAGTSGGTQSARVYLDGVDVTPQSLLLSRIKPSTSHDQRSNKGSKAGTTTRRSKNAYGGGGNSVMGASVILSSTSTSSIDDSLDNEAPSGKNSSNTSVSGVKHGASSTSGGHGKVSSSVASTPVPVSGPPFASSTNQHDDDESGANGPETDESVSKSASALLGNLDNEPSPASLSTAATSTSTATGTSTTPHTQQTMATQSSRQRRRPVTIELAETPTMFLFELRSVCVSQDASYHQTVAQRNRQYLEICAQKKGSDKFIEGRSQTLQLAQKGKEVMTAPPATRDAMCVATDWDIFDWYDNQNEHDENGGMDAVPTVSAAAASASNGKTRTSTADSYETGDLQLKHQVDEIVDATLVSPGCVLDVDGDIVEDLKARQHARIRRTKQHGGGQRSRTQHSNTLQSQQDVLRRSSAAMLGSSSSSSAASPSQSGANLSFGASQDAIGNNNNGSMDDSGGSGNLSAQNSQVGMSSASHGILSGDSSGGGDSNKQNAYARANTNVDIGEIIAQQRTAKVLASASLLKTVSIVERAVQQNVYHQQHVLYRNFPTLSGPGGSLMPRDDDGRHDWRSALGVSSTGSSSNGSRSHAPSFSSFASVSNGGVHNGNGTSTAAAGGKGLKKLWAFRCELTTNRRVSCLAWNTVNDDLLAVSYCRDDTKAQQCLPGLPSPGNANASSTSNGGSGANPIGGGCALNGTPPSPAAITAVNASNAAVETSGGGEEDDGLILFWSLKNPEYPERIYNLDVGVTSIDFSHSQPYLLAVGFANGVVAIYDTRKDDSTHVTSDRLGGLAAIKSLGLLGGANPAATAAAALKLLHTPVPIASSDLSPGKHLDALWQVRWISKGSDRGENVVSISSDGRVTEWSMKKGLSYSDLMTLKRVANPLLGSSNHADGLISRQASGHCIDFAKNDPSVYYVGTEDGLIHKCSVSYNEQYLQTYFGHTGPVYQLLVSPFSSDVFLSCSGDWNVKLWFQSELKEVLNFRAVDLAHAVHSISWCPSDATVFGAVSEDGRIEIWDLYASTLDPIITHFPKKYVAAPSTASSTATGNSSNGSASPLDNGVASPMNGNLDPLDDPLPSTGSNPKDHASTELLPPPQEIPLECTKIAFAPSAPIIVVGDSTGDVTVYRVPTLAEGHCGENMSVDEQVARLHKAMHPNKHE
uniref:Dynein axonemal intermediate chain 4 n=1 Tax=Globisporangium ultimum (strain ATCC 200006 / CBS 805.95 / DAOM BR144) TaxID=431595 RepID=K3X6S0_GLOUD